MDECTEQMTEEETMEEKSRQDEGTSQMSDGGAEEDKKPEEANRSGEKQEQEGLSTNPELSFEVHKSVRSKEKPKDSKFS